ncbi:DoxX family membrane protein [Nocardioides sp.]|uniref:DoxX family membrane protein n=1 Tax=Nocardioides sp. TaxID=35761 RepID=UPI0027234279|nr:DoxX family membrane protein [Nocardioides sp.]MDO9458329.1 DoxX family membrane protein [Nocardioides sp.]
MSLSRLVARPLIAAGIIYAAQGVLRNPAPVVPKAKKITDRVVPAAQKAGIPLPDDTETLVRINAAAQVTGALALATGRAPRFGATVIAGSLLPTTVAGHAFWAEKDPVAKKQQTIQFFKNLSLFGAMLIVAGDTDGKPGVAWRARRAAKDARRQSKHLAGAARREAKLAKAKVT